MGRLVVDPIGAVPSSGGIGAPGRATKREEKNYANPASAANLQRPSFLQTSRIGQRHGTGVLGKPCRKPIF